MVSPLRYNRLYREKNKTFFANDKKITIIIGL